MIGKQLKEVIGLMMIGEGVMALTQPQEYARFWKRGPAWWHQVIEPFVRSPDFTRVVGAAEILAGYWLAASQLPESNDRPRCAVSDSRYGTPTARQTEPAV